MPTTGRKGNNMIIDSKQYDGLCACGRTHKMETTFCVIESGCLKNIGDYMKRNGIQGCAVAVYDENTYRATADRHPQVDAEVILPAENLHANEHGVELLLEKLPEETEIILAPISAVFPLYPARRLPVWMASALLWRL